MDQEVKKRNDLAQAAEQLNAYIKNLRIQERSLDTRNKKIASQYQVPSSGPESMRNNLLHGLPTELVPLNIGGIEKAAWNMFYPVNFSFTGLTTLNNTLRQEKYFQVSQEAAFIMTHLSYSFPTRNAQAQGSAPWAIEFFDAQSTRQLQQSPIPLQCYGVQGLQTQLTTPYLLMPNAKFKTVLTCFQTGVFVLPAPTDVNVQVTYHGIRMRVDDAGEILSTLYKRRGA
jgi:hypothetical protein